MSINLASYRNLRTATFVRIDIQQYRTTAGGAFTNEILRFSDHDSAFTINAESYVPLGRLLGVTQTSSELRASGNEITLSLSGIPDASLDEIIHSKLKGSAINIFRAYFNQSGVQIGATQQRWIGQVHNYALSEEYDVIAGSATNTIQIECLSNVELLQQKVGGRRTNPQSMKAIFTSDTSFDRVPSLIGSQFDFGGDR